MIMPKEKKLIQKEDIMPLDVYTKQRKELRKKSRNSFPLQAISGIA